MEDSKKVINNQSGQALLEFILLFAVIAIVSFGMVSIVNRGVSGYWLAFVKLIVDDPNIELNF